jgi:hypothetical protein
MIVDEDVVIKQLEESQVTLLEERFENEDTQPETTQCLENFLIQSATEWKSTEYIAPYTAIVQGSGVGKSFSIYQIAKKHFTMSVCLRHEDSTGYPFRSGIADLFSSYTSTIITFYLAHSLGIQSFMDNNGNLFPNDSSVRLVIFYVAFLGGYLNHLSNTLGGKLSMMLTLRQP